MPDEYLDSLKPEYRAAQWREALSGEPGQRRKRYVAERDGVLTGFILVGPADGDDSAEFGEVFAVNVHPHAWGSGVGTTLMDAGVGFLRQTGFERVVLWVHPDNQRARRFHERLGWSHDGVEKQAR